MQSIIVGTALVGCLEVPRGPLWPATQLDIIQYQFWNLLVTRDVQLGLPPPHPPPPPTKKKKKKIFIKFVLIIVKE